MALVKHKKSLISSSSHLKQPLFHSRNSSPAAQLIKASLVSSLMHYTSSLSSSTLSQPDLLTLLTSLHFLNPGDLPPDDQVNAAYMWKTISHQNHTTIADAISYLLCILDLHIPDSLLHKSLVFHTIPSSDYAYIKPNSLGLIKNYLEYIYGQSSKNNYSQISAITPHLEESHHPHLGAIRMRTPKTTISSRAETPNKLIELNRRYRNEKKTSPNAPKHIGRATDGRLKRSESNTRNYSKDSSVLASPAERRHKSPIIGIEVHNPSGKSNKLTLYKEDLSRKVCITITL